MSVVLPPRIKKLSSAVAIAIATSLSSVVVQADSLGVIQVESTTIDDRFENKRNEASNISVISGAEVDAAHTQSVHEMLQGIPGITTDYRGGDTLKIHIRGIENQVYMGEKPGVAVVIDGVPVFERSGSVNIDMDNIESIKVIKGGASYLFGDDALSGAVIITTKRGAKYAGYTVGAEAGSFNYKKGLARAGFATENASGHVQVSRRETDAYWDDSASKADYLNGKLQYYIDDTSDITVGFERSERFKNSHGKVVGVTAAETDPESTDIYSYNDYTNHYDVDLAKYFVTYSKDVNATDNLMVNVYSFGDNTKYFSSPLQNDPREYEKQNNYTQVQNGLKAEYRSGGDNVAWMAATDLRANRYERDSVALYDAKRWDAGDILSDDKTDETVQAVYGEVKFRVTDPLVVTLNGRLDSINYDYKDRQDATLQFDETFNVTSWRLGANYTLTENRDLYGNISTGFRAPSIEQMFAGDTLYGDTANNPDLEPEHAINMELGLRTKTSFFGAPTEVDVAIFQIDRDDYIMKTSGQYASPADGTEDIYDNVGSMRNRGLELAIVSDPSPRLSWTAAYTYLNAEFTKYDNFNLKLGDDDDRSDTYLADCALMVDSTSEWCIEQYDNTGNVLPRTPNHHLNLGLSYKVANYWTVTGEMDAISDYYADEINRVKIDGRETFNLLVNYDRKIGSNDWSFFARIDNLLDTDYYNNARGGTGDNNDDGVYDEEDISIVVNPGRTYTAGLSVTF